MDISSQFIQVAPPILDAHLDDRSDRFWLMPTSSDGACAVDSLRFRGSVKVARQTSAYCSNLTCRESRQFVLDVRLPHVKKAKRTAFDNIVRIATEVLFSVVGKEFRVEPNWCVSAYRVSLLGIGTLPSTSFEHCKNEWRGMNALVAFASQPTRVYVHSSSSS